MDPREHIEHTDSNTGVTYKARANDFPSGHEQAFDAGKRVRDEQLIAKADELEKLAGVNADLATQREQMGLESDRAWATHHQQRQMARWLRKVVAS